MAINWNQEVEVTCVAATMKHYRSKGYDVPKQLEKFTVIAVDLPPRSSSKIQAICDICSSIKNITVTHYKDRRSDYMCHKCTTIEKSSIKRLTPVSTMIDHFIKDTGLNVITTSGKGIEMAITFIAHCGHSETVKYRSFKRRGINENRD